MPHVNIRYGTWYIRSLIDSFDQSCAWALAGYNAGPDKAAQWADRTADQEFMLRIEDVGYAETRDYVKRVLANFWTYRLFEK